MPISSSVYDFIEQLNKDPNLLNNFEQNPEKILKESQLSETDQKNLLEGSIETLTKMGMHPLVSMRYSLARNPGFKQHITMLGYLEDMGISK